MNGKNNGVDLRNIEVGDWNGKCTGGWVSDPQSFDSGNLMVSLAINRMAKK